MTKYWSLEVNGISHKFDSLKELRKYYKNFPEGSWTYGEGD